MYRIVKKTALIAVTIFTLFLFLEIIATIKKPQIIFIESTGTYTRFNINYGLEPKPNIQYKEFGNDINVNSFSMYGPETPYRNEGVRLAFLGDSFNQGVGINYKKNYPYLTTQILQKTFQKHVDFVNGSIGDSSPLMQELILKYKIIQFKPDYVIYELYDDDLRGDFGAYYSRFYTATSIYNLIPSVLRPLNLVRHYYGYLYNRMQEEKMKKYVAEKTKAENNPKYIWDTYTIKALDSMLTITRRNKAKFVLFYLPVGWELPDEYAQGAAKQKPSILHGLARQWAKKNGVPFADMTEQFQKVNTSEMNELYQSAKKGYHMTPQGARITAIRLSKLLTVGK